MKKTGNNYDKQIEYSRKLFLEYSGAELEKKAAHLGLPCDEEYLYFDLAGERFRLSRLSGVVAGVPPDYSKPAGFNETLSIYDVLCCSADTPVLAGRWASIPELNPIFVGQSSGGSFYHGFERDFTGKAELLSDACRELGGKPFEPLGSRDLGYVLPSFSFLPLVLLFNDADDEFPAQVSFLWDRNVLDFIHFETIFYVTGHVLERIRDISGVAGN